jgi:hypothetical protein
MTMSPRAPYDADFYESKLQATSRSAATVLGLLYQDYKALSLIDVGCGRGAWLGEAERLGATSLQGMDGPWLSRESLLSRSIRFSSVDFEGTLPRLTQRFDLCISLEVAEHISADRAEPFIQYLCDASDVVLFGAAIKRQGGAHHVNEQWQSYWIDLFRAKHYECFDVIRPRVWCDPAVEWWYRQNTFLFVNQESRNALLDRDQLRRLQSPIFDAVHPANYESKIAIHETQVELPTLRFCLNCFKRYARNKLANGNHSA